MRAFRRNRGRFTFALGKNQRMNKVRVELIFPGGLFYDLIEVQRRGAGKLSDWKRRRNGTLVRFKADDFFALDVHVLLAVCFQKKSSPRSNLLVMVVGDRESGAEDGVLASMQRCGGESHKREHHPFGNKSH